jgi:hypothetical protein
MLRSRADLRPRLAEDEVHWEESSLDIVLCAGLAPGTSVLTCSRPRAYQNLPRRGRST